MLKSIIKALLLIFATTLVLVVTSVLLCYTVRELQGNLIGNILSFIITVLIIALYSEVLGKIGNLIDRL